MVKKSNKKGSDDVEKGASTSANTQGTISQICTPESTQQITTEVEPQLLLVKVEKKCSTLGVYKLPDVDRIRSTSKDTIIFTEPSARGVIWGPAVGGYSASATGELLDKGRETFGDPLKDADSKVVKPIINLTGNDRKNKDDDTCLILLMCLCGCIFGIIAFIFLCLAKRAEAKGDIKKAEKYLLVSAIVKVVGTIFAVLSILGLSFGLTFGLIYRRS